MTLQAEMQLKDEFISSTRRETRSMKRSIASKENKTNRATSNKWKIKSKCTMETDEPTVPVLETLLPITTNGTSTSLSPSSSVINDDISHQNSNGIIHFSIPSSSNQDRGRMWKVDNIAFYLVCDGHGTLGGKCADYVVECLYEKFTTSVDLSVDDLTESINQIIADLDISVQETISDICLGGGTTLSLFISRENDNYIVNLGDSEIVLFDKSSNQHEILSEDHSPQNISEFKRMIKFNKDVVFEYDKIKYSPDIYSLYQKINKDWVKKAPPTRNIYFKNLESQYATYIGNGTFHKLSVTRSIGDFIFKKNYGVSSEPYIRKISKLGENQSIIIASDGFWDCWKYTEVMEVIANNNETLFETLQNQRANQYFGASKDDSFLYYIPSMN